MGALHEVWYMPSLETAKYDLLQQLRLDPLRYASALGFFSQRPLERIVREGNALALIGTSDERWAYLVAANGTEIEELLSRVWKEEGIRAFATIEDWMVPPLCQLGSIATSLSCLRYVLQPDVPLSASVGSQVRQLTPVDASTICAYSDYGEYISEKYVREVIQKGFSGGIEAHGGLVAWATTHDDLAIGNLHVLPDYRCKGYAATLVTALAQRVRKQGHLPVMNIEPSNRASRGVAERLGFTVDRPVTWLKLRTEAH